jgi:hypothetical protein
MCIVTLMSCDRKQQTQKVVKRVVEKWYFGIYDFGFRIGELRDSRFKIVDFVEF